MSNAVIREDSHAPAMFGVDSSNQSTTVTAQFDSTTKRLLVDATTSLTGFGTLAGGTTTITTSGTAVVLKTNTTCSRVVITAQDTNTGTVYVGASDVLASSKNGIPLTPLSSITLDVSNTDLVYLDSTASGDKVSFIYQV